MVEHNGTKWNQIKQELLNMSMLVKDCGSIVTS